MARYDDLNTNMIAYSAVLSIIVLVIVLQGTQALCYNMVNWVDKDRIGTESDNPSEVKREQLQSLDGYRKDRVIDDLAPAPAKGQEPATKEVLQIPVSVAEQLILKEFRAPAPTGA